MTANQYDLEQAIMAAWTTADDLDLLAEHTLEHADEINVDQTVHAVLGLQRLHHMRMQKVWQIFENLLESQGFSAPATADKADLDDDLGGYDDGSRSRPPRTSDCKWPRDSER
jgi:hypothetical protein